MKKNLIKLAFSTLCAASVLMGCTQKNVNDTQMKNEKMIDSKGTQKSAIEIPNEYHKEINSVVFDIDTLEIPEGIILDNLHECSITKQRPDQEKILELYSNGKEIVKSDSMESTTLDGSTGLYEYRAFSDGSQINAADGNVGWMTKFASKISYSFDAYNLDKYATSGEFDFGSREVCVHGKTRFFSYVFCVACGGDMLADFCGAAALPNDGVVDGLTGVLVPNDGGFALVGDTNSGDVSGSGTGVGHSLLGDLQLSGPNLYSVMLNPTGLGEDLSEFLLCHTAHLTLLIEQDAAIGSGTGIQCHNVFCHYMFLRFPFKLMQADLSASFCLAL